MVKESRSLYGADRFTSPEKAVALVKPLFKTVDREIHPSGNPTPSQDDYQITQRMKKAGEILGIVLADHIIIGDESYFSFNEHGELGRKSPESIG